MRAMMSLKILQIFEGNQKVLQITQSISLTTFKKWTNSFKDSNFQRPVKNTQVT